ncbi:uncharacterized protein LOC144861664 [Branchiostoma floridae x Branchiostoma japonicum]
MVCIRDIKTKIPLLYLICYPVCTQQGIPLADRSPGVYQPIGVQDDTIIKDDHVTASSQVNGSEAYRGRLNGDGAWQSSGQGTEFLAVDLEYNRYIFGIQTQGQGDGYVETYRILYQVDNTSGLVLYSEDGGSAKIFSGNSDNETIVQQNFTSYIYARYILVNPQNFSGAPRLRIELLGVDELPTTNPPVTTTLVTTLSTPSSTQPQSTTEAETSSGVYQTIGIQDDTIIPDDLMTASSQVNGSEAYRGRLNGDGAWQPSGQGTNEFLAVDLQYNRYIFGIQTQGQGDGYVETYMILYQVDNTSGLLGYSEDGGSAKIFSGNSDNETIVQQNFTSYIYARYILVNPQTFYGAPRLRIELLGVDELPTTISPVTTPVVTTLSTPSSTQPQSTTEAETSSGVYQPIGIQDDTIISDALMTATSQVAGSEAYRGRLNGDGAWQPSGQGTEFLAVDLEYKRYIFGIQTQGQGNGYVETYRIIYQVDNTTGLVGYSEDGGSAKIFSGNSDNETIVQQNFTSYIYARYILVIPQTFSGAPRLRIELLGVDELPTTISPVTSPLVTTLSTPSSTQPQSTTAKSSGVYQPIGVEDDRIITIGQMTSSSEVTGSEAYRGRLNGDGAWEPTGQGTNEFLAVDLEYKRYIFGIQTQGQGNGYVETYRILYQVDNTSGLVLYSEDGGNAKIFSGNSDNETIVQQNFTSYIYARYILVNPQNFSGAPRLRIELLGVDELPTTISPVTTPLVTTLSTPSSTQPQSTTAKSSGVYQPIGVEDDSIITIGQMTSSSEVTGSEAYRGRLNGDGAWQPTGQGTNEFLAVDLQYNRYIFGIQTQGQGDGYVETYRILYQVDNTSGLVLYSEDGGNAKIFSGNSDNETIVQQNFTSYIYARYILINPQNFSGAPRLRIELLGVDELPTTISPVTTPLVTTLSSPSSTQPQSTTEAETSSGVYQPIGVQDDTIILDDQMDASSEVNGSEAYRGRLNGDGAWQPSGQGTEFLAVDLQYNRYIFGIQTQGQGDGYVETYRILYLVDNTTDLRFYSEDGGGAKIFTGNSDNETIVQQNFTSYIYARYFLVNPQTFSGAPRLRIELLGVDELTTTSSPTTPLPWTTTQNTATSYSTQTSQTITGHQNPNSATVPAVPTIIPAGTTLSWETTQTASIPASTQTSQTGTEGQDANSSTKVTGKSSNVINVGAAAGSGCVVFLILILVAVILCMRRRRKKRDQASSVEETPSNSTGYVNASFVAIAEQTRHRVQDDALPVHVAARATNRMANHVMGSLNENDNELLQHIPLRIMAVNNRELSWNDISLTSKLLGEGHFGEVRKGTIIVNGERIPSAIKILKSGANDASRQDFQQEVDIMRHVGYHPNIVNLLGVCIYQGQQFMALEMAGNGDLLKFLRKSRVLEAASLTYVNRPNFGGGRTMSTLSPVQLLRIACDVATGMDHLSSKQVIHRDLAARNVLLTDSLIAKVADFGLSRGEGIYEQTSKKAIPFRSTALEALTRRIYTTKSDVWSFGTLLWEIVTIGGTPYCGMKSRTILGRLREGYRLPKPRNCEADLYQLMLLCWKTHPEDRPSFADLAEQLEIMIEDKHSYVNVDKYDDFEYEMVDSSDSDVA